MIDFKSETKGVWFYFDEDKHNLGGVCLRIPTSEDYEGIERLTVRAGKPDYHRGVRYETEKTDEKLRAKLSLRKSIVDWKGVSLDGQELECNDKNKEKMVKAQDFQLFIGECIESMVEGNKTIEAARVKNLESSPSGGSTSRAKSAAKSA